MSLIKIRPILYAAFLVVTGCFSGPGLFQQESSDSISIDGVDQGNGVVTGEFKVGSNVTQTLGASEDSSISGSSVSFPPGSLSIDTSISIEEGGSLAGDSLGSQVGVDAGRISAAGPAVAVQAGQSVDANQPFSLRIPAASAGLRLGEDSDQLLIVIYKVTRAAEGQNYLGIIPRANLTVKDGYVIFETKHFGSFQAAYTEKQVTKSVEVASSTPILTKLEEAKLAPVVWDVEAPSFDSAKRVALFPFSAKGFSKLASCTASVYDAKKGSLLLSESETKDLSAKKLNYNYDPGKNKDAHTAFVRMECEDINGRRDISPWGKGVEIAAKGTSSTSSSNDSPIFTGNSSRSVSPEGTRIVSPDSAIAPSQITLTGACNPALGLVHVDASIPNGSTNVPCATNGTFQIVVGDAFFNGVDIYFNTNHIGGYKIRVSTANHENDDDENELNKTFVYRVPSNMTITYVDSAAQLDAINSGPTASIVFIQTDDINLASYSNWTPIGNCGTFFNGVYDGGGHAISNLTISINTPGSNQSCIGLFGKIADSGHGAMIANLDLINPQISVTTTTGNIQYVGTLVGKSISTSYQNEIREIGIFRDSASQDTVTISSSSATVEYIGGLVGQAVNISASTDFMHNIYGSVEVNASNAKYVGGAVGWLDNGSIHWIMLKTTVSGKNDVGGFVGHATSDASMIYLGGWGSVMGNGSYNSEAQLGGLVGRLDGTLEKSYSAVTVNQTVAASAHNVGGLVGDFYAGVIKDSFASGNITANVNYADRIGGLAGQSNGQILRSFSTGIIAGRLSCGGLIGYTLSSTNIQHSFSLSAVSSGCISNFGGAFGNSNSGSTTNVRFVNSDCYPSASTVNECTTAAPGDFNSFSDAFYQVSGAEWDTNYVWEMDWSTNLPTLEWLKYTTWVVDLP